MKKIYQIFISKSWWVILIVFSCYIWYGGAIKRKNRAISKIENCIANLEKDKLDIKKKKKNLILRVNSQSDPEWIEMVLMKKLGVVPEGKVKIHFTK